MSSNVQYRMLAGEALEPLFKKLKDEGQPLPNPLLTVAWIGEVDGKIVSHAIIHSIPVVEYVHAQEQFGDTIKELFERCRNFIVKSGAPRVLSHTEHRAMKLMMKRAGFSESAFTWYEWRGR